jgi:hypothetical protein
MSVDYYLACDKCKQAIHVAQDGMGGFTFYSGEPDCLYHLGRFLEEHTLCGGKVTLLNEHHVIDEDLKCVHWTIKPR